MKLLLDTQVADVHAELFANLRRAGTLIGAHDMMIAATALAHGLVVVTHNVGEFGRVEALRVEDWQA